MLRGIFLFLVNTPTLDAHGIHKQGDQLERHLDFWFLARRSGLCGRSLNFRMGGFARRASIPDTTEDILGFSPFLLHFLLEIRI